MSLLLYKAGDSITKSLKISDDHVFSVKGFVQQGSDTLIIQAIAIRVPKDIPESSQLV